MGTRLEYPPARLKALREAFSPLGDAPIFTVWRRVRRGEKWSKVPDHPAGTPGVGFDAALALYTSDPRVAGLGVKLGRVPGADGLVLFGVDYDSKEKGPLPDSWPKSKT